MDPSVEASGVEATAHEHIAPLPRISVQAFCESQDLIQMIEAAALDRRMSKAHVRVQKGGISAALEAYRNASTPNLIILETAADRVLLVSQLEHLAEYCDPGTKVLVVGYENDIALYRQLTAQGVSDYIVWPISLLEFIQRMSLLYNVSKSETLGRSVAVMGAKGGVGASTLAQNLAWSISKNFNMETVIADLDLPFGTVALNYNQDASQGISEAVYSPDRLDAQYLDGLLSRCGDHLSILAAPVNLDRVYDFEDHAFDPIIETLSSIVPWAVLDVPHCWTGWVKRALLNADEVVIVACPDLSNLRNAKLLIDSLRYSRPNDRSPQIVLNMIGVPRRPEIAVTEFSRAVGVAPAAEIPFDARLFGLAANNGQMLGEVDPSSKIVEIVEDLGRTIAHREKRRRQKRGLFGGLIGRFARKMAS